MFYNYDIQFGYSKNVCTHVNEIYVLIYSILFESMAFECSTNFVYHLMVLPLGLPMIYEFQSARVFIVIRGILYIINIWFVVGATYSSHRTALKSMASLLAAYAFHWLRLFLARYHENYCYYDYRNNRSVLWLQSPKIVKNKSLEFRQQTSKPYTFNGKHFIIGPFATI